jgi:alkaline phosphatase D
MKQRPPWLDDMARTAQGRRAFLRLAAASAGARLLGCGQRTAGPEAELSATPDGGRARPGIPYGVQSGDVSAGSAVIWAASDRPARMRVRWSKSDKLAGATTVMGEMVTPESAFAGKLLLEGLPAGQDIFYEVVFEDPSSARLTSAPLVGHLRTAPEVARDLRFLWSGDTAGQGWGINLEWGGMRIYDPMRELSPDFFIHSGDRIYADSPIQAEVALPDGKLWKNVVIEGVGKVAETLEEFRARHRYNLLDARVRAFGAHVAQLVQWDDHEVLNNWYPGEILSEAEPRYRIRDVSLLAERGRHAFMEWTPIRIQPDDPRRIHRAFHFGPLLDVFMLDMRSFRGPNTPGREPQATAFLGEGQIGWLKQALASSKAVWKVIAADMPVGLVVPDGAAFEGVANGNGPALGRELELASLLSFIKSAKIFNVVWLTADVHYTAAHHYHPSRARFTDFSPFWEMVSGPLHAGTFGPNELDDTFGPEVRFQKAPPAGQANLPPSAGWQFFGEVLISAKDRTMTVNLRDLTGAVLFSQVIPPAG